LICPHHLRVRVRVCALECVRACAAVAYVRVCVH